MAAAASASAPLARRASTRLWAASQRRSTPPTCPLLGWRAPPARAHCSTGLPPDAQVCRNEQPRQACAPQTGHACMACYVLPHSWGEKAVQGHLGGSRPGHARTAAPPGAPGPAGGQRAPCCRPPPARSPSAGHTPAPAPGEPHVGQQPHAQVQGFARAMLAVASPL